jgi:hypothetical protein
MSTGLNDNQKQKLMLTFRHIDNLLNDTFHALYSDESTSPFKRYRPDLLPGQRKVIGDYLTRLRALMVQILAHQGITIPEPKSSALWTFKMALFQAKTAVEELDPKHMRGYGDLSKDTAHGLKAMISQIMDVLESMNSNLTKGGGQDARK